MTKSAKRLNDHDSLDVLGLNLEISLQFPSEAVLVLELAFCDEINFIQSPYLGLIRSPSSFQIPLSLR